MASPSNATDTGQDGASSPGSSTQTDFRPLLAWIVFIGVLFAASRNTIGRAIIYYGLLLLILFVVLTQYQWFANALQPLSNLRPGLTRGKSDTPGPNDAGGGGGGSF